jgi:hypothetical protein
MQEQSHSDSGGSMTILEHLYALSVVILSGIVMAIAVVKIAMHKEEM